MIHDATVICKTKIHHSPALAHLLRNTTHASPLPRSSRNTATRRDRCTYTSANARSNTHRPHNRARANLHHHRTTNIVERCPTDFRHARALQSQLVERVFTTRHYQQIINANVARALISSSPDEGTRRLYELDPVRIVPGLRPYHDDVTTTNWETSEKTLPYLEERIDSPIYVALGEIHVHVENIESPIFKSAIQRALARNLILHIHSDAETIRAVYKIAPEAKILWAHAGLTESPQPFRKCWMNFRISGQTFQFASIRLPRTENCPTNGARYF